MSLDKLFGTDKKLEQTGITIDYPGFSIRTLRASQSNKKYQATLSYLMKPYLRFVQQGIMDDTKAKEILQTAVIRDVLLGWEGELVKGTPLPKFNEENVLAVFKKYPDFWTDLYSQVQSIENFQAEELEDKGKNSVKSSSISSSKGK